MNQPAPDPKEPKPPARPTPHRLHPDHSLSQVSLEFSRKQPNETILVSLQTGRLGAKEVGKVVLNPDGTILNGNTRVKCLEERGYDLENLWNFVEPEESAAHPRFDELFQ